MTCGRSWKTSNSTNPESPIGLESAMRVARLVATNPRLCVSRGSSLPAYPALRRRVCMAQTEQRSLWA